MSKNHELIDRFADEAKRRRYTRRQVVRAGLALGLSGAMIDSVLAMPAFAQDATASPAAGGPVMVPIVGKEMSFDDIKAAIADEKEVNVGNWTYSANDALIKRFQDYVKDVYDEDITLNYTGSQTPSTYITDLTIAVGAGDESPYDVLAIEENYWAEAQAQGAANGDQDDGGLSAIWAGPERRSGAGQSETRADVGRLPGVGDARASPTTPPMSTS